jgi:hypothetical protein
MPTFKQGYSLEVKWRLDGAGADTTLYTKGNEAEPKVDTLEVTNTGSSGIEAYYAGITRDSGKVDFLIDISAFPWATIGITAGAKGTLRINRGGSTYELKHVLIESFKRGSTVNGMLEGSFNYRLDSSSYYQGASAYYTDAT